MVSHALRNILLMELLKLWHSGTDTFVAFSTEGTGSSTIVGKRDYLGYQYRGGTSGDRIIMIIAQVTIHMQNNVWTWQG